MQARAAAAVTAAAAASAALLAVRAREANIVRARIARVGTLLDDAIDEASANEKQLLSWAAYFASAPSNCDIDEPPALACDNPTGCFVLPVAPAHVDVECLPHRLVSAGIDASRSVVSGQGLTAYDRFDTRKTRKQNVICLALRDADGGVAEWITPADICLKLRDPIVGASVSCDIVADGDNWRVTYLVCGNPGAITLQLRVNDVQLWQGDVRVRNGCCVVVLFLTRV
jgi:hypothetical protein